MSRIIVCVFWCVCFPSLSKSVSSMCSLCFISFYFCIMLVCMDGPHFLYPLIHCWTFSLFPHLTTGNIHVQAFVWRYVFISLKCLGMDSPCPVVTLF